MSLRLRGHARPALRFGWAWHPGRKPDHRFYRRFALQADLAGLEPAVLEEHQAGDAGNVELAASSRC